MGKIKQSNDLMQAELFELRHQLFEAQEIIESIRRGQIDALVFENSDGNQLYTLKTADQAYRVFIERMAEGAVTLNQSGTVVYSNSQFATITGYPLTGIIGASFRSFVAEEYAERYDELFEQAWGHNERQEILLSTGRGVVPVLLSVTALQLEEGPTLSILITDLTQQKLAQDQLREANRQLMVSNQQLESSNHDLQQFASVASHDLQEPLRKIQIFSTLMLEAAAGTLPPEAVGYVNKMLEAMGRMKSLIVDVLNYSRLSAPDNDVAVLDLERVVHEVLEDFDWTIREKNAAVTTSAMPSIRANKGQIRQVFQNIISNALKFARTDRPPRIHIRASRVRDRSFDSEEDIGGPYCRIHITDNGIGFEEKYLPDIFALFERLHSKDTYEGTGIGLSITKKIVEKHHGMITAKSSPGNGADFIILLPVDH